jgi:hypothetical protein
MDEEHVHEVYFDIFSFSHIGDILSQFVDGSKYKYANNHRWHNY